MPGRERSDGAGRSRSRRSPVQPTPVIAGAGMGAGSVSPVGPGETTSRSGVDLGSAPSGGAPSAPTGAFTFDPRTTGELPVVVVDQPAPELVVEPALAAPRRNGRPRVRKVTRVIRHVDAWSVCRVAFVFFLSTYAILLVAGVLLWSVANSTGTIDNVESFIRSLFVLDSFTFESGTLLRASVVLGALFVVAGTAMAVTAAVLFNLIADLVGGIRVTVLEEEVLALDAPAPRRSRRRR